MKKFIAIILVTIVCVLTLSSCALTTPGALKTAAKYDNAGYTVAVTVDADTIDKTFAADLGARPGAIEQMLEVLSEDETKEGIIVYYSNTNAAKNAADYFESLTAEEENVDYVVHRKGNMVFFGHEACWNDVF